MTDEQKKKPGRDIGGIRQFATFGSEDDEETNDLESQQSTHPTIKQSRKPATQKTRKLENQITRNSDSQISSNLDSQIVQYPERQQSGLPESQIAREQDFKMVSYQRKKKPERETQIIYMPPGVRNRLKHYALDHKREISEVVTEAIEQYLDRQEGR